MMDNRIQRIIVVAALVAAAGCSTISRTEKQLSRVDPNESPDIPSIGELPPVRPVSAGLAYSYNTLVVYYNENIGTQAIRKAVAKYGADIISEQDYISALVVRIPDGKSLDDAIKVFSKVKGVLDVSKVGSRNIR